MASGSSSYGPRNTAAVIQNFQWNFSAGMPVAVVHYQSAMEAKRAGRWADAEWSLRRALVDDARHADAWHLLGVVRHRQGYSQEAETLMRRAIAIRDDAYYCDNLGNLLWETGRLDEAEASYRHALVAKPDYANAHYNLSNLLKKAERIAEAIKFLMQALTLQPEWAEALCSLGFLLHQERRLPEALACYRQALSIKPDYVDVYLNLGSVFRDLHRPDDTLLNCQRALAIMPDRADVRFNHAITLLQLGEFRHGWREYEYRWKVEGAEAPWREQETLWSGNADLHEKSIVLHAEQGLGDTLQFVRYATMVAARGAEVYVVAHPSLKSLLMSCEGVKGVFAYGESLPSFDYQCSLMSLPLAFGTELESIPAGMPYLSARPDRVEYWRQKMEGRTRLRVGIVWAGEPRKHIEWAHAMDRQRSLHFDQVRPLVDLPGTQFYSLQIAQEAKAQIAGVSNIVDFSEAIENFEDSAALIQNLDLVISVDTSVAHLAGAVGKPVWLLDRYSHCWRWLIDREDSPWYPQMRIFRQQSVGDWSSVITRVKEELSNVVITS